MPIARGNGEKAAGSRSGISACHLVKHMIVPGDRQLPKRSSKAWLSTMLAEDYTRDGRRDPPRTCKC